MPINIQKHNKGLQPYVGDDTAKKEPEAQTENFINSIKDKIPVFDNSIALDVGCGNGRISKKLSSLYYEVVALDPYEVPDFTNYSNIHFTKCFYEEYTTKKKFDLVIFLGVFYLFQEKDKVLQKTEALLTDTGNIIIFTDKRRPYGKKGGIKDGLFYDIKHLCKIANLTIKETINFDTYTIIIMEKTNG
jgi:2-polyprenyl-3-methyl-5-hydroxy-6-metoxy-1,4-benzoquinol methylase